MIGSTVCRMHGGAAPQVKRKAALRLIGLVEPAIATLAREMTNQNAKPGDRLRAVENVLDRAGMPRNVGLGSEDARDVLLAKLMQLRDQAQAEALMVMGTDRESEEEL